MSIGVFLARFQPLHKSHEFLIKRSLEENEVTYIFIGSADKSRQLRNPFTIAEREKMLKRVFATEIKNNQLIILPLSDFSHENDSENNKKWGEYLYNNITNSIKQSNFSLYYSDTPEIMLNWFDDKYKKFIKFKFFDRKNIFAELSATKIREAILNDNDDYLLNNLPIEVYHMKDELKKILKQI